MKIINWFCSSSSTKGVQTCQKSIIHCQPIHMGHDMGSSKNLCWVYRDSTIGGLSRLDIFFTIWAESYPLSTDDWNQSRFQPFITHLSFEITSGSAFIGFQPFLCLLDSVMWSWFIFFWRECSRIISWLEPKII